MLNRTPCFIIQVVKGEKMQTDPNRTDTRDLPIVQQDAPSFSLNAVANKEITQFSLSDFKNKWVCLFFYPLDFTFVCPTEIIAFSEKVSDFDKLGCQVLGASIDSQFTHLAWINTPRNKGGLGEINFPLLADTNRELSRSYGVLSNNGVALRGLFLINPKGKIVYQVVHDLGVGRSVDETLRVLEAFQTHEKTGDVCPANWGKSNSTTMTPNPKDSKSYFEKIK